MPCALAVATIREAFRAVFEQENRLASRISFNSRLRVSDVTATRQTHPQEIAVAGERDPAAGDRAVRVANRADCRAYQPLPKPTCLRVVLAPKVAKFCNIIVA